MSSTFIICSAIAYVVAYSLPLFFWWTILVFLIPFFYEVIHKRLTLVDGVIWSAVACTLHLFGVLEGLTITSQSAGIMRLVPAILVLVTAIVYGILWFASSMILCGSITCPVGILSIWVVTTWCHFIFLEHGSLWMLGAFEGYFLCSPLIPLIHSPGLLYYVPKVGSAAVLLFLIITQAFISSALLWGKWWWSAVAVCMIIWGYGLMQPYNHETSNISFEKVVCATRGFKAHESIAHTAYAIRDYCKNILQKYPQTQIIIMPESAVKCPLFPAEEEKVFVLDQKQLGKPITLIFGGFRWDNDLYRNTAYWIDNGRLTDIFDKRHAMALTERAPHEYCLGAIPLIKKSYFKKTVGISPSRCTRPVWKISLDLTVIPYICSELFFNTVPDHQLATGAYILALCNDAWIERDSMRYAMLMGARFRALQWQIPIIYVAYHYQAVCMPTGTYRALKFFDHTMIEPITSYQE